MSRIAVTILALAVLAACAPMLEPQPPAEPDVTPTLSLRRAVLETMEAVAQARQAGSSLRACEVQAQYHVGAISRSQPGEATATPLGLGVIPEEHAVGSVTLTLIDDRCLARPRAPAAR